VGVGGYRKTTGHNTPEHRMQIYYPLGVPNLSKTLASLCVSVNFHKRADIQRFDIEDKQVLQGGEQRAREVRKVKGEMDLVPLPEG
jgi:hypothetical protein